MKLGIVVFGVCGMAAAASAQSQLHISLMARQGDTWTSQFVSALPGQTVQVGVFMSGEGVYGFAGATLRLTATGMAGASATFADGTATGRVGPFNFGAATNAIFSTADGFRIDAASDSNNNNANAGFTFFQRDPATAAPGTFSTANPVLCFLFDVHLASTPGETGLQLTLDQLSRDVATYYLQGDSRPRQASATLQGLFITVPTPGSATLLAGAGILACRRRGR